MTTPVKGRPVGSGKFTLAEREMRLAYHRMRAQAKFRNEKFNLIYKEFEYIWTGFWHKRGKNSDNLCMRRINVSIAWQLSNIDLISRKESQRLTMEYIITRNKEKRLTDDK